MRKQQQTVHSSADASAIRSWLIGRVPAEWQNGAVSIEIDRDEITITLPVDPPGLSDDATEIDIAEATDGRISGWREDTRERRMAIAREAEHRYGRTVSWAVAVGDRTELFTHLAAPVMTRLRQPERQVLDTLIDANIVRSRAEAVAWCVRLVGQNTEAWLGELRDAMRSVEDIRNAGPGTT